jgi:ethanolamine ammonia-lyase small subunit
VTPADPWAALRRLTPSRIALGHTGGSLPTAAHLEFQLAHARAREAVHQPLDLRALLADLAGAGLPAIPVRSAAADRVRYLQRPDLGRRLDAGSRRKLAELAAEPAPEAVLVAADGLSALAVQRHAVPLLAALMPRLTANGWRLAPVVVAELGRVALGDEIGAALGARIAVVLIGERPGLSSPDSLGAYLTYAPAIGRRDSERNCVSNIRPAGLPPRLAAERLWFLLTESRRRKLSGIALKDEWLQPEPDGG